MNSRRSLTDALQLNAEKVAFINGDSRDASVEEQELSAAPPLPTEMKPNQPEMASQTDSDSGIPISPVPRKTPQRVASPPQVRQEITKSPTSETTGMTLANVLIPLTTRLQPYTALALKRASLEQRLRGSKPATVQEIVEESVSRWLHAHGYLQPP